MHHKLRSFSIVIVNGAGINVYNVGLHYCVSELWSVEENTNVDCVTK